MPDYKNGKIYKLWCHETDEIYIGSTCVSLSRRLSGHKTPKNNCVSKILFEKSDNVKIELIQSYPCENKDELNKKEGEYIRKLDCINKVVAGRTVKEWKEDNPEYYVEYYKNNKEYFTEKNKEYQQKNKEYFTEKNKEYQQKNKETFIEYNKEYREKNKEIISETRKKKITCELCNCKLRKDGLTEHINTKKHQGASATVAGSASAETGSTTGSTSSV